MNASWAMFTVTAIFMFLIIFTTTAATKPGEYFSNPSQPQKSVWAAQLLFIALAAVSLVMWLVALTATLSVSSGEIWPAAVGGGVGWLASRYFLPLLLRVKRQRHEKLQPKP